VPTTGWNALDLLIALTGGADHELRRRSRLCPGQRSLLPAAIEQELAGLP